MSKNGLLWILITRDVTQNHTSSQYIFFQVESNVQDHSDFGPQIAIQSVSILEFLDVTTKYSDM